MLASDGGLPRGSPRRAKDKATGQLYDTMGTPKDPQETRFSLAIRESFLEKKLPKLEAGRKR